MTPCKLLGQNLRENFKTIFIAEYISTQNGGKSIKSIKINKTNKKTNK